MFQKNIQKISELLKKILQRRDDYFMIPQVTLVQKISSEDVPSPSCNGAQKSICCTLSGILITASMTQGENYGRNIRLFAKNLYPLNSIQPVWKRLLDTLISPRHTQPF